MKKEFLKSIFRGLVKSVPGGNILTEVIENVKTKMNNSTTVGANDPIPHKWISIVMQAIGVGAIVWAFCTHAITLDQLLGYVGFGK